MIRNPEGINFNNTYYAFNQILSDLTPDTINAMLAVGAILILEPVNIVTDNSIEPELINFSQIR
jgi:hypothetical protein